MKGISYANPLLLLSGIVPLVVCRAWVPSSRRVLFYRVHVKLNTAHAFAKLLRRPEKLTFLPFIRELEFLGGLAENRWMTTVLPKIAKHIPPLIRAVILNFSYHSSYSFIRPPFDAITRLEIMHRLPRLKFDDVINCITSFSTLEVLRLWMEEWADTAVPEQSPPPPATLRYLDLRCNSNHLPPFLEWMTSGPAEITTLLLHIPSSEANCLASLRQYIGSLSRSLRTLRLSFSHQNWPRDSIASAFVDLLRLNTQLHALTIRSAQNHAISLLQSMHLPPSVQSITMVVPASPPFLHTLLPPKDMPTLDSRMASLGRLREFRIMYFRDFVLAETTRQLESVKDRIDVSELPGCVARGILSEDVVNERYPYWYYY
ncbi:hypothetical protein MVEN_02392000 [Mycena venus]|uniref:F-box domain-containing protein n=1 Tax=Mycena venus TaxID=2733690 RepID=A0A8H6X2B8_9AGAR|nr:hypothetical protein MVEN_02392000 [Mycena venus]